jgi:hypothetical protein
VLWGEVPPSCLPRPSFSFRALAILNIYNLRIKM